MQVAQGNHVEPLGGIDGSIVTVQWNESLELYLYHAQFHWKENHWAKGANYTITGELPALLPGSQRLPFALSFAAPKKGAFPVAELTTPQPQISVRSVRVAAVEAPEQEWPIFPCEARITLARRFDTTKNSTTRHPIFKDAAGAKITTDDSASRDDSVKTHDIYNLLLARSPIE